MMKTVICIFSLIATLFCQEIKLNKDNKNYIVIAKAIHSIIPIKHNWLDINGNKQKDSFEKVYDLNYIPGLDDFDILEFLIIHREKIPKNKKKALISTLEKITGTASVTAKNAAYEIQYGKKAKSSFVAPPPSSTMDVQGIKENQKVNTGSTHATSEVTLELPDNVDRTLLEAVERLDEIHTYNNELKKTLATLKLKNRELIREKNKVMLGNAMIEAKLAESERTISQKEDTINQKERTIKQKEQTIEQEKQKASKKVAEIEKKVGEIKNLAANQMMEDAKARSKNILDEAKAQADAIKKAVEKKSKKKKAEAKAQADKIMADAQARSAKILDEAQMKVTEIQNAENSSAFFK